SSSHQCQLCRFRSPTRRADAEAAMTRAERVASAVGDLRSCEESRTEQALLALYHGPLERMRPRPALHSSAPALQTPADDRATRAIAITSHGSPMGGSVGASAPRWFGAFAEPEHVAAEC